MPFMSNLNPFFSKLLDNVLKWSFCKPSIAIVTTKRGFFVCADKLHVKQKAMKQKIKKRFALDLTMCDNRFSDVKNGA